ncbi:hypothetical protein [Rhodococcus koreensis]|uniref:hypothetical protein n=1 Tax=Rhodococcus koreensis TaxID=99653 RepID=UPI00367200EC
MEPNVSVDRDEIADLLEALEGADLADIADAILEAGYRKPRTIASVGELDALPEGAVILSEQGGVWERQEDDSTELLFWVEATQGQGSPQFSDGIALPATVIHRPKA